MKPPPFDYARPGSVAEAALLLARPGARVLAGGQSLIPALNQRDLHPSLLVDINRIPGLDHVRVDEEGALRLGATVRQATAESHPLVRAHAPALAEAAARVGWLAVRTRGTVLGSLAQGAPYAELPGVALLLDARLRAVCAEGERWLPAAALHGPEGLRPGELLTELALPASPARSGQAFLEVCRRSSGVPAVSVSARVSLDDRGAVAELRAALTGVGPRPLLAPVLDALVGVHGDALDLDAAAREVARHEALTPPSDVHGSAAWRRRLVQALLPRVLRVALARARGGAA